MTNPQISPRAWAMILGLSSIWAFSYLFMEWGVRELPVMTVVLGRVGIAAVILLIVVYATGNRMPATLAAWGGLALVALLNNVIPFGLIIGAQGEGTDTGLVSILIGLTPVFSVVLAHFLTAEETMTPLRVGGVLLALGGLVVLVGPAALSGLGDKLTGQLMAVGGALSYALAAIAGRRFLVGIPPLIAAAGQLTCATVIVLPWVLVMDTPWIYSPSLLAWAGVLGVAIPATALAYILYFSVLATAGATNLLLVTFLVPLGAVFIGALFLQEAVTWPMLAGMALIFGGLTLIDGRVLRKLRPRRVPQG